MLEKEKTCAFTGHRPEKLHMSEKDARALLCRSIERAIKEGYTTFITGMAKGIDIWAAEAVLDLKLLHPEVKLVCALPFPNFEKNAPHIIQKADFVHTVMPSYSIHAFQKRNEWMVDNSSLVIAIFQGEKGGTENTVKYAEKHGVDIMWAEPASIFRQIRMRKIYE